MKNGKKPNVRQSKLMQLLALDHRQWLVCKDTPTEMEAVHRETGEVKVIKW